MVLLEPWIGVRGGAEQNLLAALEADLAIVPTTSEIWKTARKLGAQGVTAPATDVLIATCAEHHGLELAHRDSHFDHLE